MVSRRADDAGAQLWWAGSTPEQGQPLNDAGWDAIWQKAGQNQQQGQCLQLLCKLWHRAPAPSEPAHIDAGALAGAQLWPPHSLNAGA
jgi:hypothetical protein